MWAQVILNVLSHWTYVFDDTVSQIEGLGLKINRVVRSL